MCLSFSKLPGKLVKYVNLLRIRFAKKSAKDLFDDVYAIIFPIFFINDYVVGSHLNSIDKSMELKWVPIYAFIKK